MKALTLHQPWASLIADGRKLIETRAWGTRHRGDLAIHAAKRSLDENAARSFGYDPEALPLGAVLCIVELYSVEIITSRLIRILSANELLAGTYRLGRYAFHLKIREVFQQPIPAQGFQMIWNWRFK